MSTKTYKNTTDAPVAIPIRLGMDAVNTVFSAGPGETFDGPAWYEEFFRNHGCIAADAVKASADAPVMEKTTTTRGKKGD